jgi:hypothetical protein
MIVPMLLVLGFAGAGWKAKEEDGVARDEEEYFVCPADQDARDPLPPRPPFRGHLTNERSRL